MKSSELAGLAKVSVRTLRHYHQVGVLPEPPRGHNGYRDYSVHDLVRLLRIRRLVDLGIPLDRIGQMLDDGAREAGTVLDELESAIDDEIRRLESQRTMIRMIRASDSAPDLPPQLAPFVAKLIGGAADSVSAKAERDYAILLNHLAGSHAAHGLADVYSKLVDVSTLAGFHEMRLEFDALPPEASDAAIDRVVAASLPLIAYAVRELGPLLSSVGTLDTAAVNIVESYHSDTLNGAQLAALRRLEAELPTL